MNENERTPAETAADYAVHFADGFFVPCPCCGKEVKSPDNGFTSEKEAMEWALGACDCAGAKAWQQQRPALRMDSPCVAGKMKAGRCGHTAYTARCTGSACSAYHPELYAPDLYARAFDLYAKRKADEKEWAEFHPTATIMRYCRQLPAPVPYWEPPTYKTGSCTLAATAPALTQQEVFNRLTNNGQLQGLYMSDGKLYINAQYIAAGRIASVDGKSYFDLNTGNAVLRGSFSTLERTNSTGTYRVFFDSGNIACQKKNGDNWDSIGFLSWNYGVSPPETWIKASRVDVLNSLDTPAVWLSGTGYGKTLYAEGGLRRLDVDNINGYKVQWYWDPAISKWVLAAKT